MKKSTDIDSLGFEFFREFARAEYCLKAVGLRDPNRKDPTADWGLFASELQDHLMTLKSGEVADAVNYYIQNPPKKQVLRSGVLDWDVVVPDHATQTELVLRLICRVRNNLFHGGKFNGHWFEPERSEFLLHHGLTILRAVIAAHPKVSDAYANKAV